MSTSGDTMSTSGGYHEYIGGCEYSKFILDFQLQFGTYEAESEHFRWEKEKRHFKEWFSSQ